MRDEANDLIGTVGDLIEDRLLPSSGQAPDAYLAILGGDRGRAA